MRRRTAKGDYVDFDLIKAKNQMAEKPPPEEVSIRQEIIERRLRRKSSAMNPSPINKPKKSAVSTNTTAKESLPVEEETKPTKRRQKTQAKPDTGDTDNVTD